MNSMTEILQWCERTGKSYWEYVKECEESDIWDYLQEVWKTMQAAVKRGLDSEGVLPGPLNLRRKLLPIIYVPVVQGFPPVARTGICLCLGSK